MVNIRKRTEAGNSNIPEKRQNLTENSLNQEFLNFKNTIDIYKTFRFIVPTDLSVLVQNQISVLEKDDECKVIMPETATFERNIFVYSINEDVDVGSNTVCPEIQASGFNDFKSTSGVSGVSEKAEDGNINNIANVVTRIATLLADGIRENYFTGLSDTSVEVKLLLNDKHCGSIIGVGGRNLERMRKDYNCDVSVTKQPCPNSYERICQVYGPPSGVYKAIISIIKSIRSHRDTDANKIKPLDMPKLREFYNCNNAKKTSTYGGYYVQVPGEPQEEYSASIDYSDDPDTVLLRMLIPSSLAGVVIGKKANTIRAIRTEFRCKVSCVDKDSADRVIEIMCDKQLNNYENAFNCLRTVCDTLSKQLSKFLDLEKEDETELRYLVPNAHVGYILGRSGSNIEKIRKETACAIKVYDTDCPNSTERVLKINGTLDNITLAAQQIYKCYSDRPVTGMVNPYKGVVFNSFEKSCDDYGGYIKIYNKDEKTGQGNFNSGKSKNLNQMPTFNTNLNQNLGGFNNQRYSMQNNAIGQNNYLMNAQIPNQGMQNQALMPSMPQGNLSNNSPYFGTNSTNSAGQNPVARIGGTNQNSSDSSEQMQQMMVNMQKQMMEMQQQLNAARAQNNSGNRAQNNSGNEWNMYP